MNRDEMHNILQYLYNKKFPDYFNDDSNKKKIFRRKCQNFTEKDGVLYYKHPKNGLLRVVSEQEKNELIRKVHNQPTGHLGETRTWRMLSYEFYWLGIVKDVASFIQQCQICRATNVFRKKNYFEIVSPDLDFESDNQGEVHTNQPPKQAQLFPTKFNVNKTLEEGQLKQSENKYNGEGNSPKINNVGSDNSSA